MTRGTGRGWRAALLLLGSAGLARAEELPRYDANAYCHRMSGLSGPANPALLDECLHGEQRARDQLAPRWARLSGPDQAYCDRLARSAGGLGRYVRLKSCTDRQLAMALRPRSRPR